jgi:hypothetical protein
MCWTLNHQNIIEMAQEHISLSHLEIAMEDRSYIIRVKVDDTHKDSP